MAALEPHSFLKQDGWESPKDIIGIRYSCEMAYFTTVAGDKPGCLEVHLGQASSLSTPHRNRIGISLTVDDDDDDDDDDGDGSVAGLSLKQQQLFTDCYRSWDGPPNKSII